jgi:hypothetical protein
MDVSVVITTYNSGPSLRQALLALRRQTCRHFEVIVVNGPSTDNTGAVLAEFGADVRVAACPEIHRARARNLGVELAASEVIAFLGDDALPCSCWLEELLAGYDADGVAGVGGPVYSPTEYAPPCAGMATASDRFGNRFADARPPFWGYHLPWPERFLRLPGGNASFRRRYLEEVGGFDEEIESTLDHTDLCLRLVDRGYRLRLLPGAAVYREPIPGPPREPFVAVRSRAYFALRALAPGVPVDAAMADCDRFAARLLEGVSDAERDAVAEEVDLGRWVGVARGRHGPRRLPAVAPARPERFRAFPTRHAGPDALTVCFVSAEMPPERCDEAGWLTWELARGCAARGHEIHFLTRSPDHRRLDLEEGVWVHRLVPETEGPSPDLPPALKRHLAWAATVHRAVRRIRAATFVDLVSVPLRDGAGIYCLLDDELTCVLTPQTPLKLVTEPTPPSAPEEEQRALRGIEELALRSARHTHNIGMQCEASGESGADADSMVERALRAFADIVARGKAA